MNSYQLISKLRKVRGDTYLSTASQALYHELVAICNDMKWKEVFFIRSSLLCANLDISDNTLRKSRESLAGAQLIYYKTSKDRRIGCYYSFVKSIDDDVISSSISPAISSSKNADETSDDIAGENVSSNIDTSSISSSTSSVNFADESQIPHIIDNINIKQEDSLAHTHESSPLPKKKSRKEIKDEKPLVYPFSSIAFMSAWETLRQTPKWKKKLNYALQLSLDKLSNFEEEFAIRQVERAIESGWTGVVFTGTERDYQEWLNLKYNGSNRKTDAKPDESSAGIQSIIFGK